jgi:hypothetical protein
MSEACRDLHEIVRKLPRFKAGFDASDIPPNGVYFLFEAGENAHNGERIVRVGTHTGEGNLPKRLLEHLYAKNKDRSIFRKHVGRCILRHDNHPYSETWEYDLTSKANKDKYSHLIDKDVQSAVEEKITDYMTRNFSFSVVQVDEKTDRLHYEERLIATLSECDATRVSSTWLGNWHPNPRISRTGLWNIQGHDGKPLSRENVDTLFDTTKGSANPT